MKKLTRRQMIGGAIAGAAAIAAVPLVAQITKPDVRVTKLIKTMEGYRKKMPPAQGLTEQNGMSVPEIKPYLFSHLAGVSRRMGVKTKEECYALMPYLQDRDCRLRFIAQQAINKVTNAYPSGMSVSAVTDTRSKAHAHMLKRFSQMLAKMP